jgi:predicted molibdopterin-dependent oxidoreductase YjgC
MILCLGFDGKYAQSVVEVELERAKKSGARLITFNAQRHSLSKSADEWLQPDPGEEADVLEMLIGSTHTRVGERQNQMQRVAQHIRESKQTVILLGPSLLTHSDSLFLLKMVERLVAETSVKLVMLPDPVNLAGALQMGITTPVSMAGLQDLSVLHLVGEAVPSDLPAQPFILYQNIYPPVGDLPTGLILPAAAFTEEDGTVLDHSGRMRSIHRAVQAPGEALPAWQVLCRIARKLGAQGFDYENESQIRAEFEALTFPGANLAGSVPVVLPSGPDVFPAVRGEAHSYMGFPLGMFVAGFRLLYPD